MAKRYKLPEEWGGVEAEESDFASFSLPEEYVALVTHEHGKWFVLTHRDSLTEVPPPIPDEPGPGAYLVGGVLCVRFGTRAGAQWLADTNATPTLRLRMDWPAFVETLGITADTPIEPLVRKATLPEVELPWLKDGGLVRPWHISVERAKDGSILVNSAVNRRGAGVFMHPDIAREMAAALLAAAGEVA